ncbi:SDR family NAD(P)-dependent oxidoreductase [Blastomonas sp.]|uniref:SDR family NAD(P)-dependent oxidoreductase n=1 Tax=Blastomonas sp. TaxID=1909299 RepID=UPI0026113E57|nr:SDR family oxidoreductase [Blastomonas sp.]MDM7957236.1 SDR family oxidoreductase [Blastomonas sp.]
MSSFDLTGRVAVITGSSRGIGASTARKLAEHGAKVVISSRKQDACDALAAEINAQHGTATAIAIAASISRKEDLQNLVDQTRAQLGPIDILVCNAASNPYYGPMGGISDDQFRKILDNNILSNHWLIQMALPDMRAAGRGSVIIISSIGGMQGARSIGVYNISKAADFQLARNLAVELGVDNIRVNCIAPGLIQTDMARALWEDEKLMGYVRTVTPLRRIGQPDEIADAAVFLASDASTYITGQSIVIDGGTTIAAAI